MTTFSRATITIATIYGPQEVQAMVRGGLAVHGSAGLYTISHVASGKAVCHSNQQRLAKGIAIELLDSGVDWLDKSPDVVEIKAIIDRVSTAPQQLPSKPIVPEPLVLEPLYPTYFAPSDRLQAVVGEIAKGHFGRIEEANELQQREMIMARFAAGKRATISEADIPIKGLVVYALPPGIEPGYAGVAQLTKRLWSLGKEIDKVAETLISGYGDMNISSTPWLSWWMDWDAEFSRLVKSGWCDWAIAVNLFSQLSAAERKKVTDVLGFVGSDEQGWHAFGAKTFLRSKRLPELLRCRRAVQEALNG